jgi:2-oxoglutarate dehydrogenase E2 component (dihydrolipoamide succinyltransferase)
MRQTIAKRLKQSQESAASLTTFNEIDMSSLQSFRSLYKDSILKTQGVKLGFMSAFARASCLALREIPAANASIEGDTIVYRDYVDLSVAVATEKGLVTPVVRNAEGMGLVEIEQAIAALGKKVSFGQVWLYGWRHVVKGGGRVLTRGIPFFFPFSFGQARDNKLGLEDMAGGTFTM